MPSPRKSAITRCRVPFRNGHSAPAYRQFSRNSATDRARPASGNVVKELEFPASLPPLEIHRLSVDLVFEHFERNATHVWPLAEASRALSSEKPLDLPWS